MLIDAQPMPLCCAHSLARTLTPALSPWEREPEAYRCTTDTALLRGHSLASDPSPQPSPRGEREPEAYRRASDAALVRGIR